MSQDSDFRERIQRIGGLVRQLESIPDPSLRAAAKELVQSVMDLHGAAVDRVLEIVSGTEQGTAVIDSLAEDPLVGSLLLLYGLHPVDFETRALRAVAKLQSILRGYGGKANLLSSTGNAVRIQVDGISSASSAKVARAAIEEEIYALAPDLTSLEIVGLEHFPTGDFVSVKALQASPRPAPDQNRDREGAAMAPQSQSHERSDWSAWPRDTRVTFNGADTDGRLISRGAL